MVQTGKQTILQLTSAEPSPYFSQFKTSALTNKSIIEYKQQEFIIYLLCKKTVKHN